MSEVTDKLALAKKPLRTRGPQGCFTDQEWDAILAKVEEVGAKATFYSLLGVAKFANLNGFRSALLKQRGYRSRK